VETLIDKSKIFFPLVADGQIKLLKQEV